jgi:hypothetical protein
MSSRLWGQIAMKKDRWGKLPTAGVGDEEVKV